MRRRALYAAVVAALLLLGLQLLRAPAVQYAFPPPSPLPEADRAELARLIGIVAGFQGGGAVSGPDRAWMADLLRERSRVIRPVREGIHREWVYEARSDDHGATFTVVEKPLFRGSVPAAAVFRGRTLVYAVSPGIDASVDVKADDVAALSDLEAARLAANLSLPLTEGMVAAEDRGDGVWRPLILNVKGRPPGIRLLDPEILPLEQRLRLYYFAGKEGEPWGPDGPVDVPGEKRLLSLLSNDGVTWTQEGGARLVDTDSVADPTLFRRGDQVVLLQNRRTFVSEDGGWSFRREPGFHSPSLSGFGSSVIAVPGGYRAWFSTLHGINGASSPDGVQWKPEGVVLPGVADPAAVVEPDGRVRLFFKAGGEYQVRNLMRRERERGREAGPP